MPLSIRPFPRPLRIGTHSGSFHCDESLACFMLLQLYPDSSVIRSRDSLILDSLDLLVDVGLCIRNE